MPTLHELIRSTYDHRWVFGVEVRSVSFADHRSGTSAIKVLVGFGPWEWVFYPCKWPTPPRAQVRIITMREKLAATHGPHNTTPEED